jgi:hypothetical protein
MNKDEFCGLPTALALDVLWRAFGLEERLKDFQAPRVPMMPKYDYKIWRKGGYQWASETDLDGLRYWLRKAEESAENTASQYAERDAKKAQNLTRWLTWRACAPEALWSGKRDERTVTAEAPSRDPRIHARDEHLPPEAPMPSAAEDDDIPF